MQTASVLRDSVVLIGPVPPARKLNVQRARSWLSWAQFTINIHVNRVRKEPILMVKTAGARAGLIVKVLAF